MPNTHRLLTKQCDGDCGQTFQADVMHVFESYKDGHTSLSYYCRECCPRCDKEPVADSPVREWHVRDVDLPDMRRAFYQTFTWMGRHGA